MLTFATAPATVLILVSPPTTVEIFALAPATVVTLLEIPATVVTLAAMFSTADTSLAIPATVVTSADTPATEVTSADIPATVVTFAAMFSTAEISLDIPATVTISAVIELIVDNPVEVIVVSVLPSASKDKTLEALVAFNGKVTVAATMSVSNSFTDLSPCFSLSAIIPMIVSNCVFNVVISKALDGLKSTVLSTAMSLTITTISPSVRPEPKTTEPPPPNS